jgi:hypothetical protein
LIVYNVTKLLSKILSFLLSHIVQQIGDAPTKIFFHSQVNVIESRTKHVFSTGGPGPNLKWMSLQNKFSLSWYFSFFSKDGNVMNKCVYVMIFMHVHYAFQKKRKEKYTCSLEDARTLTGGDRATRAGGTAPPNFHTLLKKRCLNFNQ